ncbi:MAG: sec-independent protein translocase protein TatA [Mariniblastus sp.]|jgi:sec-independent protein translocase protein TatA
MTEISQFDILPLAFTPGWQELLIVGAIFLLLFGGAKLPSLMRNLGRSVNEFKEGIKESPADGAIEDGKNDTA